MDYRWTIDELNRLLDLRRSDASLTSCGAALGKSVGEVAGILSAANLEQGIHPEARGRSCMGCGRVMLSGHFGHRHCFTCRETIRSTPHVPLCHMPKTSRRKKGAA